MSAKNPFRLALLAPLLAAALLIGGCKSDSDAPKTPPPPVAVSKTGREFDPPVKVEQIPKQAWYCDMGTVHYARHEKGDGKCTVCEMDLTQAQ